MAKTLFNRVANECPALSFKWIISKEPGWRSRCWMMPTRPILFPALIMATLPISNLMWSKHFPDAKSYRTVSCTLTSGSGYLIVRPSWVTQYGMPLGPCLIVLTLHNLYVASSLLILWITNFPFVL